MRSPRASSLTPRRVSLIARIAVAIAGMVTAFLYYEGLVDAKLSALLSYVLIVSILLGFPRARSADIAAGAALLMSTAEFASAIDGAHLDLWRWLSGMAAIGTVVIPLHTQRLRALMLHDGWRPLSELNRRRHRSPRLRSETIGPDAAMDAPHSEGQVRLLPAPVNRAA